MDPRLEENWRAFIKWLRKPQRWAPIGAIAIAAIALPLTLVFLSPMFLGWFAPPLDRNIDLYAVNRPVAFTFLDSQGRDVGHRGAVVGERLALEDMPAYLPAAFISVEDRRFYAHQGIDIPGLIRASLTNLRAGKIVAGGSTITQQAAKIIFTQQERTASRKLTELVNAAQLENALSKKQILELYLNRLYLGSGAFGVDGAARVYFGKSAKDVTLPEAAMLATLTRAPSVFTPRRDLAAAQARASRVLAAMVETGAITKEEAADARAHPAKVIDRTSMDARNYFLDTAADEARALVSVNGKAPMADLIVHTTLDTRLQETARQAVTTVINTRGKKLRTTEAAVVLMQPDGAVVAMIGGVDYASSVFNRATQARRQPGSAFKPFVYLAAMESGLTPWDVRDDQPVNINGWQPTNFGGNSYGTLTLADALAHSVNTITANLAQEVGVPAVVQAAQRVGIVSPLTANPSLALGTSEVTPLEMASAYAAFANGGYRVYPYLVTRVDTQGGQTLYNRTPPAQTRVIASRVVRDMNAMMYEVVTSGTGTGARLAGHETAGKTGTTQDSKDAWFVGFTTDYVAAVWVGNDNNKPTRGVTGGSLPAAIWKQVMTAAEKGLPAKPLDRSPPEEPIYPDTLLYASGPSASLSADDESSNRIYPPDEFNQPQSLPPPPRRRSTGLFDWLFGRDEPESNARPEPPPEPEPYPPPRRDDRFRDPYRDR
jgi:penicillin-binding protein 1A